MLLKILAWTLVAAAYVLSVLAGASWIGRRLEKVNQPRELPEEEVEPCPFA